MMDAKTVELDITFTASVYNNDEIDKLAGILKDKYTQLIKTIFGGCDCNEKENQEEVI